MRLLIINPNTSRGVTARIAAAAEAVALPGDRFTTLSAAFGPALIVTPADTAEAVEGVLATVRAHDGPVDGIVLGSFGDTGADAVRALRPGLPVVGLAGAAFAAARALGGPTGIVTFGARLAPGLREMAEAHGLGPGLVGVASLPDGDAGDPSTVQERCAPGLARLAREMAGQGASAIVLGGGPLAGLARAIGPAVPVPVIDGVQAAVGLLRSAVTERGAETGRPLPEAATRTG
ncbi:MAG: aspartate/glutamate racemase family protein [Paracoccaceae bacterium]|jgi:Asp/Glu/hydantoin racemase|nr:aspartate/glutamate racemase family protein [Paracoccaceae bacterium]